MNKWLRMRKIKERLPQILSDLREAIEACGYAMVCGRKITSITTDEHGEAVVVMEDEIDEDDFVTVGIVNGGIDKSTLRAGHCAVNPALVGTLEVWIERGDFSPYFANDTGKLDRWGNHIYRIEGGGQCS